jgi:hypothetical protein
MRCTDVVDKDLEIERLLNENVRLMQHISDLEAAIALVRIHWETDKRQLAKYRQAFDERGRLQ